MQDRIPHQKNGNLSSFWCGMSRKDLYGNMQTRQIAILDRIRLTDDLPIMLMKLSGIIHTMSKYFYEKVRIIF